MIRKVVRKESGSGRVADGPIRRKRRMGKRMLISRYASYTSPATDFILTRDDLARNAWADGFGGYNE